MQLCMKIKRFLATIKNIVKYKYFKIQIPDMIHVYGTTSNLKFKYQKNLNTRQENTIELLKKAFSCDDKDIAISSYIWTGDRSDKAEYFRKILGLDFILAYSTTDELANVIAIPDFIYGSWKEAGIESWESTTQQCREAGEKQYEDKRLFWIGNLDTHETRRTLIEISNKYPDAILAEGMSWLDQKKGEMQKASKFVSLCDHAKYKYLIDVQGIGWSGRLKLLFHLKRPVFIADRVHKEFYFDWLVDMQNCVIIKEDLSDLKEKLDILEHNDGLYNKIVEGQNELVDKYISKEAALGIIREIVCKYGKCK